MAASSRPSAQWIDRLPAAAPDLSTAKAITRALPSAAQAQKPQDGRCRCAHAPTSAVASGSTPRITLACTASTCRIAIEVHSGNPNTAPAAMAKISGQSPGAGFGARVKARKNRLKAAGDGRAAKGNEQAGELRRLGRAHGQPRHRQGQRKDQHAEQAEPQAADFFGGQVMGAG